jgi:uncharacterized protein (TIGR02246 family)
MTAKQPEDVNRLFGERVNAGDLDGVVALYEPHATLVTQDAGVVAGRDAIRAYFEGMIALRATIDMGTSRVVPAGEDLAVTHHEWHATMQGPDGAFELTGKATEVVRRQPDGRWLFVFDDPDLRS